MHIRYNSTSKYFEWNNGGSWEQLDLSGQTTVPKTLIPVGGLFSATVSTNPNTLLGYGTWARFGEGKVIVSQQSSDADFDSAEETGGAKTVTLDSTQIPAHTHPITDPSHYHDYRYGSGQSGSTAGYSLLPNVATDNDFLNPTGITGTNANTGGGQPHNNMPPYIVAYIWKRTA